MRVLVGVEVRWPDSGIEDAPHLLGELIVNSNAAERNGLDQMTDRGWITLFHTDQNQMYSNIQGGILAGDRNGMFESRTSGH